MIWPNGTETHALRIIVAHGECMGLDVVRSAPGVFKRGAVYVVLGRMEEKGYIESREEDAPLPYIGIKRRIYKATEIGRKLVEIAELHDRVRGASGGNRTPVASLED